MTGGAGRWVRRALVAGGALVAGYAIVGALGDPDVRPVGQLLFLGGVLVAHDGLLLPVVIGLGALAGRYLPAAARAPVALAGLVTVSLLVVAVPLVGGFGRDPGSPSVLPLPYGRGLLVILAVAWGTALAAVPARRWHHRRQRQQRPDNPTPPAG